MIEVENLTKRYGDKTALAGVSFGIDTGQIVGLLGKNGAGKSTTMNILTGYISATEGKVAIGGYDIAAQHKKAKQLIGYLPEQPAFYPEMRVEEHLGFVCGLKGVCKNKQARAGHIAEICAQVGIGDVAGRMIKNLSKGYRQRVGFAAALIGRPKVIVLDEPSAGLDPSQTIEMRGLIKESSQTSTVIVSSHILSEIQSVCNRVIVINKGQVIADDTPEGLTAREGGQGGIRLRIKGHKQRVLEILRTAAGVKRAEPLPGGEPGADDYAVFGETGRDIREEVFYALAEARLPVLEAASAVTSLEDVFIKLTGGSDTEAIQ